MEENTLDFLNPLEPLGTPGNANLSSNIPAINDPLKDPVINFPKDSVPLTYMQTREDLVDRPGKNSNLTEQTIDREQVLKSLGNMWKGNSLTDISSSVKSKAYSYDNSADSGSFYKRYQAYGQEKFDKIGFSPLRDNEAIFNENTSRWNDFNRMMTHSWWPLFSQGFIAGPKSLYKAIQGDFGSDLEDASVYAEAAAIGQSSKGGLGSFMSNAFMNFAYTAGIITESIVEMGAAALLAAPTGGSSLVLSGANLGRKSLILGKGLDNLRKAGVAAPGLERAAGKALTGMEFTNSLKNLKQIENARSVFKWAKAEKALTSPVGRFINPFAELTEGIASGLKASQNLKGWAKTSVMAKHTAGGLYRNVHTINAALAEARLEGGMVENSVFDQLYRSLTPEERNNEAKLKDIRLQAQMAGNKALIANVGVIYASNKIVFDNIYGGKGPISRLMNKRTQDIMDLKTGKLRVVKPGRFGKAKDLKKPVVEYTKNNFKNMVKDFAREPLRKSTRGAITYFKANVSEGLQENAQEAIAHAAENYYIESFKNPDLANSEFARAQILHGIQEQFTAQGFETFASGFAMGAFAGPLNSAPKWASIGYNRIADPKAYADYVTKRDNYGAKLAETLNNVDVKDFFDNPIWNYSSQSQINKSLFEASTEEEAMAIKEREIREDAFIQAMSVAMEKGMMDVYYEQIDSAAKMTQEEFEEAYGLEKGAGKEYLANIGKIRERAEAVETRWKEAKELFPEPEDIGDILDRADKNSVEYEQAALLLSAWKEARKNYVFFNQTFENTKALMQDLSNDVVNLTSKMGISSTDVKVLFDKNLLSNEIGLLKTDVELVESMENLTPEQKKELKEKKEKLESLTELKSKIIGFENINLDKQEITERIMDAILEAEISKIEDLVPEDKKKRIEELTKEAKEQAEIIYETKKELIDSRAQELEIAFKDYIRTLNKDKDYEFKDGLVDSAYQKFKRFYELDYNQKEMAKLLNIVGDEQGYLDMVQNNMVWMKKLYDNRKGYYEEIIKKGFENLENNDLLNALAAQGIYISEEALEDWVENANIPEEFFLQDKEAVIKEGHHQYLTYARLFANVARNRKTKTSDLELKQYYEAKDKLIKERDDAIAALPTTFTRTNTVTLDITTPSTLDKFANQIGPETYVELTYTENKEDKTLIVFQDKDGLFRYDDAEGNPFRDNTTKFKAGQVFIMSEKPDPAEVEKINQEYAQKINEIDAKIQKYKAQNKEPYVNITKDTPYSELPSELKNKLIEAYRAYKNEIGAPVPVDAEISEDDITNFIKTNIKAKNIIDRYNAEMNAINEQPVNYDPVFVDKDGVEKKASEFTEKELKDKLLILDNDIEKLEKRKDLTPEESAELETYRNLKIAIEGYLQHVNTLNFTEAQRKIQALFQEKVLDIQNQILTPDITNSEYYEVNGSKKARVTNLIRDLKKDPFINTDLVNIVDLYEQFLKGKEISNEDLDAFKKAFSAKSFQGFNYTNTQNKFLRALGKNVTKKLSEEDFRNLVNTYQWQESRDAGNYIHKGAENLFYGITIEKDSSVISDEAYEQLFGGQGFIRKVVQDLKSKNMVLLGVESMVYGDEYAGTIDMIAVDPEGVIHIIDIKTGEEKKWKKFVNATDSNRESYGLQLAAYSALLQGMLGTKVEFSTKVLPVQVTYDKSGKVTSAKSPEQVKGLLTPNDNYIDININETNPLLEDSPINKIRSKIPLTSAPGETIKVATDINPELKDLLIKAGVPELVINRMTKEEQAEFRSYTDKQEQTAFVNRLIEKYAAFKDGEIIDSLSLTDDIETKKADIERRIQEVENFVNQEFFADSELLSNYWKTKKDLFSNKVKQLKDLLQKGIKTGEDLRTLTNLLNDIRGILNEGININNKTAILTNEKNIQELANSLLSLISDNVIKEYIEVMNKAMESRVGSNAVEKMLVGYSDGSGYTIDGKNVEYFLSKETLDNAKNNKQINAKYDAELNALEQQVKTVQGEETEKSPEEVKKLAQQKFDFLQSNNGKIITINGITGTLNVINNFRYELETEDTIYEYQFDQIIDYSTPEKPLAKYNVQNITESSVTVNNVDYTINLDQKGNVESISPLNKPEQRITNEALIIAVEVERNKLDLENVDTVELEKDLKTNHSKINNILENIWGYNLSENIASSLNKLYDGKKLTESESLAVDLWLQDVGNRIFNLIDSKNSKEENEAIEGAYETYEIIYSLLYNLGDLTIRKDGKRKKARNVKEVKDNVAPEKTKKRVASETSKVTQTAPAQEFTVILDSFAISEDASLVEPGYSKLYESYAKQMNEASTINDAIQIFNQAAADTNISIDELKSLKEIGAALRKKLPEPSSTQTEVLTLDKVNAGDILVDETGQTYKVFKIGDTLKANHTDPKITQGYLLDAQNISKFVKTSEVGKTIKPEPVVKTELTEEEKEALKNNKDGVDVFLTQKDIKAQNQKEVGDKVSSEKLDTLKNNLLNDILC